jgi:bacillithiol system protein YtxJ
VSSRFNQISSVEALEEVFDRSATAAVILFNHDPWCPVSARAFTQMQTLDDEVSLIDVSSHRSLTREIQARTGVRHESPQVIVLRRQSAVWSASHFAINADAVLTAVGRGRAGAGV